VLVPIERPDNLIEFIRSCDSRFQDRLENADGSPQPEVGSVEQFAIATKGYPAAARLDISRLQGAQFLSAYRLDAASTGSEVAETQGIGSRSVQWGRIVRYRTQTLMAELSPPTIIIRDTRENTRKCSVWPLRDLPGLMFLRYPMSERPMLDNY